MDTVKVRELPVKSGPLSLTDLLIVEDNDGTKTTEVKQFRSLLQQSIYFNTVEDMKSATLNEGDVVQTLGYREPNDGGGAIYKIVYAPTDLDDGMLIHYLHTSDTLRAHLITDGSLNVLQCGVFGDGVADDYSLINKAAQKGLPLYFPKRTYKISGPLEFKSGTVVDFNGSTIKCEVSSCICLGLNEEMNDIVIRNSRFIGKYGVEIYPYSKNIVIENCIFDAISASTPMEKAISINGATDIAVRGCTIGTGLGDLKTGIQIASGTKNKKSVGNANILITGSKFVVKKYGINMTSTITDRNTIISNNQFKGSISEDPETPIVAIQMSCNSDSILISSCGFNHFNIAIRVAGVVDVVLGCSDIICDNVSIMYGILSDAAIVTLSGLQKFNGYDSDLQTYQSSNILGCIFERMSGLLYMNTVISKSIISSKAGANIQDYETSLTGSLVDTIDPVCRDKITITNIDDIIDGNPNIPGYMNIAIDVAVSGNITDLGFAALNGQLVALYSSNGAVLKHNTNILCGQDITLNQYTPVILKNINGLWTRVA